ncbi:MAG: hypothetical protein OXF40_07625, partial [Rhodospirillales bacterium]|nr:hypothetical protein [Rhodospirillales bacterium]
HADANGDASIARDAAAVQLLEVGVQDRPRPLVVVLVERIANVASHADLVGPSRGVIVPVEARLEPRIPFAGTVLPWRTWDAGKSFAASRTRGAVWPLPRATPISAGTVPVPHSFTKRRRRSDQNRSGKPGASTLPAARIMRSRLPRGHFCIRPPLRILLLKPAIPPALRRTRADWLQLRRRRNPERQHLDH